MIAAELSRAQTASPAQRSGGATARSGQTERVEFPAVAESVLAARAAVVDFGIRAGLPPDRVEALRLAVSEAVTNAVRHAYRDGPGTVRVTASVMFDELLVRVEDDGCGPDVPPVSPGLGWGCRLMELDCDRFSLERGSRGGTRVSLRFRLHANRAWSPFSPPLRQRGSGRRSDRRFGTND